LETGEFREHERGDLLTRLFPVAFDPTATAPNWEKALAQWLPDEQTRAFVQDAAGASLCGVAFDEFWMFLYGDGANGKSTFTRVLEWLFGDYAHKAQAETFMDCGRDRDRGKPSPELLSMRGKRLVTVQETAQRHRLNEALIKDLTGRDTITARGVYEAKETTFAPQFTLWMFGNHKPQVRDTSAGTWRRIRLIPFTQTIAESDRDAQLSEKLKSELPGVLNWALIGFERVRRRGFEVPEQVKAATEEYRAENDAFALFFNESCEVSKTAFTPSVDLWTAWESHCKETGENTGSAKTLGQALKQRGFSDKRVTHSGRQIRVWSGFRLKGNQSQ
jgi:putative DNA primase/helicase